MPIADVSIVPLGSLSAPPWDDIADRLALSPSVAIRAAIIEAGMASGAVSVAIALPLGDPEGPWLCFETSLEVLEGIVGAAEGARARWKAKGN